MNLKTWFPLVLAVVLGLIAMKVAHDVVSKGQPTTAPTGGTKVLVAKHDMAAGSQLTTDDLQAVFMSGEVGAGAIFSEPNDLTGRVLTSAMVKGTPVVESLLAPNGSGAGLQALIPAGMRAITLEINEISGIAGNLVPNCRVDVVSTIGGGESGDMTSRTIVQNVKVQAVGMRRAEGEQQGPVHSATILVSPREAETIELASTTGKPRLVLRSGMDNDVTAAGGISLAELRHGGAGLGTSDPFETVPAVMTKPVETSSAPTTQQAQTPAPVQQAVAETARPWRRGRSIKIIRAGVETDVVVEEVASPIGRRLMTNMPTEEVPAQNN